MNHKFHSFSLLLFLLYLIAFSRTSARSLAATKQGAEQQHHQILKGAPLTSSSHDRESSDELMGLEICRDADEECIKRRLLSEAHLDYIYTQHQNP